MSWRLWRKKREAESAVDPRGLPLQRFGAALALIWVSVSVGACIRGVAGRDSRKEARMAYRRGAWALAWLAAWASGCSGATADDNAPAASGNSGGSSSGGAGSSGAGGTTTSSPDG